MRTAWRLALISVALLAALVLVGGCVQRQFLFGPTHKDTTRIARSHALTRWFADGEYTGYSRLVRSPRHVWYFLHGNTGQAGDRAYVLAHLSPADSVYILEYPGYGERPGRPSKKAFGEAARKGYAWLVRKYGASRIIVLGESLGSGPACELARVEAPPPRIVLVVPFATLEDVAAEKFRWLPVRQFMVDRWDNIAALKGYSGRVDVFGAVNDTVIPVHHARRLAESHPNAVFHAADASHSWARSSDIDLSRL